MLVVVLIVVAMLSLAGLRFVRLMSTENKAVHLRGDELQAECLVGSGEAVIQAALAAEDRGDLDDDPSRFQGIQVLGTEKTKKKGRFCVLSPKREDQEVSGVRYGLENESARLNLGVLPKWDEESPGAAREALLRLPGMTEPIADALLDWVDADAIARPLGAEADYYKGINVPYAPRNGAPGCMEELLLVKGVSRGLLFGTDANFNYQTDPNEKETDAAEGPPWASFLTLYSAEANVDLQRNPRVFLNDKDLQKTYDALQKILTQEQARFIIFYRQYGPASDGSPPADSRQGPRNIESVKSVQSVKGVEQQVQIRFSDPAQFDLKTVLDVIGVEVKVPGQGQDGQGQDKEVTVESPFENDPASMSGYLAILLDRTTTTEEQVLRGRINIDLAPKEVLAGIPGIDPTLVDQIASGRSSDSEDSGVGRLLTQSVVDLEQMKKLLPYITTRGDVYRGQLVGFFDDGGPIARAEIVVDATASPPRRVYWKDLKLFGLAFSRQKLGGGETLGQ